MNVLNKINYDICVCVNNAIDSELEKINKSHISGNDNYPRFYTIHIDLRRNIDEITTNLYSSIQVGMNGYEY